jgi:hypothetical protein
MTVVRRIADAGTDAIQPDAIRFRVPRSVL